MTKELYTHLSSLAKLFCAMKQNILTCTRPFTLLVTHGVTFLLTLLWMLEEIHEKRVVEPEAILETLKTTKMKNEAKMKIHWNVQKRSCGHVYNAGYCGYSISMQVIVVIRFQCRLLWLFDFNAGYCGYSISMQVIVVIRFQCRLLWLL